MLLFNSIIRLVNLTSIDWQLQYAFYVQANYELECHLLKVAPRTLSCILSFDASFQKLKLNIAMVTVVCRTSQQYLGTLLLRMNTM